ncbi:MAG: hypothetical protein COW03_05330 [Cytophagales bacterium CG12_big_fil_rev_8_21_14_0_65_40_12]|nr:MAG: hypothetical protein COW03_05330 [Cytophagales bacterium CG12_big_fil_rev_8_21_14_0_65_40_12]PIW05896.1 MAG: hypothetical protein COW40_02290 [Cytophagales bacterium CG17_big_fil_post_rev_8_21_14_2_50_40_13]
MNKERFNHLLSHLNDVTNEDIKSLNELRKKYPFFQTPYVIVAKALKELDHPKTDAFIKKAAIYSPDRAHLKKIITGELVFDQVETKEIQVDKSESKKEKAEVPKSDAVQPSEAIITPPTVEVKVEVQAKANEITKDQEAVLVKAPMDSSTLVKPNQQKAFEKTAPSKLGKTDQITELEKDLIEIRERKQRLAKMLNQQEDDVEQTKSSKKKTSKSQVELIEKFIQNEPQFGKPKESGQDSEYLQEDLATKKLKYQDEFATETLAALLFKQKKYERALDIYEKLSLKFPEKRTYFALQIQKIKESQHV